MDWILIIGAPDMSINRFRWMQSNVIYLSIYLWLYSPCGPCPLFQFFNIYIVGRTPWRGDQSVARPLPGRRTTQTQNICTQTAMHRMVFEPQIPVFERSKTIHALDSAVTVICKYNVIVTWNMAVPNFHVFTIHSQSLKAFISPIVQCVSLRGRLGAKRPQRDVVSCSTVEWDC
jgi:hypothetical protein